LAWHPDRLARNSVDGGKIIYLIDINRITSLRFPQFWFEPTPQGKFMLQVAFGQSKYFSDNLVENVKRGIRQKIRRGEWLTLAPFGYVNNLKTRNIEPDKVKSRVIKRAFEEYATGTYTLKSLADFLADHGVVQKKGTPLAKVSRSRSPGLQSAASAAVRLRLNMRLTDLEHAIPTIVVLRKMESAHSRTRKKR